MKKSYLLVYNDQFGTREQVKAAIDSCSLVITWRYDMPHSFYLISEASAKELGTKLYEARGSGRFVLTEMEHYWGRASKDTWHLVKNKSLRPKQ